MSRNALVVGINRYPSLKESKSKYKHLTTCADDAEAIAQLLEKDDNFQVTRLPLGYIDGERRVDPTKPLRLEELETAIKKLFVPDSAKSPETALLFFAGHGLRRNTDNGTEGYLATSDTKCRDDSWGFSLVYLWEILQQSKVRQQILWLDCCFSGELLNFSDTELGRQSPGYDRSLITASRDYESAYKQLDGKHGILTGALLEILDPYQNRENVWVTNRNVAALLDEKVKAYCKQTKISQTPQASDRGEPINIILGKAKLNKQKFGDSLIKSQFFEKLFSWLKIPQNDFLSEREFLLSKVENDWVKINLENSFYSKLPINLRLEKRLDIIELISEEKPEQVRRLLSEDRTIANIFNDLGPGKSLLILGEPGSGKTFATLSLAQSLVEKARKDTNELIPIFLNLSSWSNEQTIESWLIQQFDIQYGILDKKISWTLLKEQKIILIFDGLDEVNKNYQDDCIYSINQFKQNYGRIEIVICSRIQEYQNLNNRLKFRYAVCIQPLNVEEITEYINKVIKDLNFREKVISSSSEDQKINLENNRKARQLETVKKLIREDKAIHDLVNNPLILSIINTVASSDTSISKLIQSGTLEERRKKLFTAYIERTLSRRKSDRKYLQQQNYTEKDVKRWLIWLAKQMNNNSQKEFLVENIQPSWLQTNTQKNYYRLQTILNSTIQGGIYGLFIGLINSILFILLSYLNKFNYLVSDSLIFNFLGLFFGTVLGLILGIIAALSKEIRTFEIISLSLDNVVTKINYLTSIILKLFLIKVKTKLYLQTSEELIYKEKNRIELLKNSTQTRIKTFIFFLVTTISPFRYYTQLGQTDTIAFGLTMTLSLWFFLCLGNRKVDKQLFPNQGIRNSWSNSVLILLVSSIFELIYIMVIGVFINVSEKDLVGVTFAANMIVIAISLWCGGLTYVQHSALCQILYRNSYMPRQYVPFLEYATKLLLLRRFGNGYRFFHPLLRNHFAQSSEEV